MRSSLIQFLLCAIVGLGLSIWIYRLARLGLLSFRYAVGWLMLSAFGVLAGIVIPVITPLANLLAITPAALIALGGTLLLIAICIQLSVSISGLYERQRRLAEELAYLRQTFDAFRHGSRE